MIRALTLTAALMIAGSAAAAGVQAGAGWRHFRCTGPDNPAPLMLSLNKDQGTFSLGYEQRDGVPSNVALREGGFDAIMTSGDGKSAYFLAFTEATGALMVIRSPVTRAEHEEIERLENAPQGQAALHQKFGDRSVSSAIIVTTLTCTREGI